MRRIFADKSKRVIRADPLDPRHPRSITYFAKGSKMLKRILEYTLRWATTLDEDLKLLREEMEGLRGDMRELSANVVQLTDEVRRLRERETVADEDSPSQWKM